MREKTARNRAMVRHYHHSRSMERTAQAFGISRVRVLQILHRLNIPTQPRGRPITRKASTTPSEFAKPSLPSLRARTESPTTPVE